MQTFWPAPFNSWFMRIGCKWAAGRPVFFKNIKFVFYYICFIYIINLNVNKKILSCTFNRAFTVNCLLKKQYEIANNNYENNLVETFYINKQGKKKSFS